jgi:hypothetical protein
MRSKAADLSILLFLTIQLVAGTGCTVIGAAIGGANSTTKEVGTVERPLTRGSKIAISVRDQAKSIIGVYRSTNRLSETEYLHAFEAAVNLNPAVANLPKPGDLIEVSASSGSLPLTGLFQMFDRAGTLFLEIQLVDLTTRRVAVTEELRVTDRIGRTRTGNDLMVLSSIGQLPLGSQVQIVRAGKLVEIPSQNIVEIRTVKNNAAVITPLVLGLLVDAAIILSVKNSMGNMHLMSGMTM